MNQHKRKPLLQACQILSILFGLVGLHQNNPTLFRAIVEVSHILATVGIGTHFVLVGCRVALNFTEGNLDCLPMTDRHGKLLNLWLQGPYPLWGPEAPNLAHLDAQALPQTIKQSQSLPNMYQSSKGPRLFTRLNIGSSWTL